MKNLREGSAGRPFLKPFFLIQENVFQSFRAKFSTGVTLELNCSQPIRIESFFMYISNTYAITLKPEGSRRVPKALEGGATAFGPVYMVPFSNKMVLEFTCPALAYVGCHLIYIPFTLL